MSAVTPKEASPPSAGEFEIGSISSSKLDECPVCLVAMEENAQKIALACHHVFHGECIDYWLKTKHSCPVCRADVPQTLQSNNRPSSSSEFGDSVFRDVDSDYGEVEADLHSTNESVYSVAAGTLSIQPSEPSPFSLVDRVQVLPQEMS